jgi:hypothetical protein
MVSSNPSDLLQEIEGLSLVYTPLSPPYNPLFTTLTNTLTADNVLGNRVERRFWQRPVG